LVKQFGQERVMNVALEALSFAQQVTPVHHMRPNYREHKRYHSCTHLATYEL
jgi:hypothetical protein